LLADGQADITKPIVDYHNFTKAPKKYYNFILIVKFSSNASLAVYRRFKTLKIMFIWKHEYRVVTNGCSEVRMSDTATVDNVGLLEHLNGKKLVRSFQCFLFGQYHFATSSFTQNS
jgi:hypothetical protein